MQKLDTDIDQFACDVHFFFKLSSARREDYAALEEVTNVTAWYALRHVSSRWLTLKPVILRLLEKWKNLITFLPQQKSFKRVIESTIRYKRITENRKSKLTPAYLAFVAFVSQDFESFLLTFQGKEARIHILSATIGSFLSKMLTKFVPAKAFMDEAGTPEQRVKSIENLASTDVSKENNQRSLKSIDIGTKTIIFLQGDVQEETKMKFR